MPRPSLRNVLALGGLAAFAVSAPVAVAPWLARTHWLLDLIANLPAQAMFGLLLAALLLAATRWFRAAAAAAVLAAAAALAVLPTWACAPEPLAGAGPSLRVMTINLLRENDANAAAAVAAILDRAPDVVFCCEVTPTWLAQLEPALAERFPFHLARADAGWFGVAMFSRLELQGAEVIPLPVGWAPALRASVRTAAGPFGLLGVHTPRPGDRDRNGYRDQALAAIPAALRALPPSHAVLGDFNATPWTPAFVDLLAATGLQRASALPLGTTWPADLPAALRIPIDHILTMPDVGVAHVMIGPAIGSDHLPVSADLTFGAHR